MNPDRGAVVMARGAGRVALCCADGAHVVVDAGSGQELLRSKCPGQKCKGVKRRLAEVSRTWFARLTAGGVN